jgi:predicted secreted Zn-dependent protease
MSSVGKATLLCLAVFMPLRVSAQTFLCTTNYYMVTGATIREIHESLRQARPGNLKSTVDGLTVWNVNWRFTLANSGSACRIATFSTTTTITITLPRWIMPTNATDPVKAEWQRYFKALSEHEYGHAQFGLIAGAEIQKRAREAGEDTNCESLKQRINALCEATIKTYKERDGAYDQRTEHGATQGARLGRGEPRERPAPPRS